MAADLAIRGDSICIVARHPLAARFLKSVISELTQPVIISDEEMLLAEKQTGLLAFTRLYLIDYNTLATPFAVLVQSVKQVCPKSRFLCAGNQLSSESLCELLLAGGHGYVSFEDLDHSLIPAIEAVIRGRLWIAVEILEQFALYASKLNARRLPSHGFTGQESSVIELLQRRLSNKEIAASMDISERTVRFHLSNIFMKIGVHDRHSAIDVIKSRNLLEHGRADNPEDSKEARLKFAAQNS